MGIDKRKIEELNDLELDLRIKQCNEQLTDLLQQAKNWTRALEEARKEKDARR